MNQQQIEIEEKSTTYDVTTQYHSTLMCQNYSSIIEGIVESDNRITLKPKNGFDCFKFYHSDPDLVIAVANMMLSFAQMVKKDNQKNLDANNNE